MIQITLNIDFIDVNFPDISKVLSEVAEIKWLYPKKNISSLITIESKNNNSYSIIYEFVFYFVNQSEMLEIIELSSTLDFEYDCNVKTYTMIHDDN